ncbi:MAG: NADH-quinone oxidoreductase subunit C [Deltaproteobacteria bacterium]|nr:NADH-quinone oxidoreductase subunit C [Deltaproteobacteria bacterium]
MMANELQKIGNAEPVALLKIPVLAISEWREAVLQEVRAGARICALFALPPRDSPVDPADGLARFGALKSRLYAVLGHDREAALAVCATDVEKAYPSLSQVIPQAHWFEREIAETCGVIPQGHPRLKPIRAPLSDAPFFEVAGDSIHEVAVGPVHAGVIEPGHFRFQCHGEQVFHLEIALGYQHRGVERALIGGPGLRTLHYMETLSGDTSIGHALAYVQAMEPLVGIEPPRRAAAIRGIALELERLANHVGDLGALAADVGYLPTASFCGGLRGDFLNLTARICGSRLGRKLLRPGGVCFDLPENAAVEFTRSLEGALRHVNEAAELLWSRSSVLGRFEHVGVVSAETCTDLGLVGPVARACGVKNDVRADFPSGIYRHAKVAVATHAGGDVFSRARVRWLEIQESGRLIRSLLSELAEGLAEGPILHEAFRAGRAAPVLAPDRLVVSLVEGWRGEICHVLITDRNGRIARYKVIDPSFHNWSGLEMALRNQQISDFPLCNKSFNLSYCGHDL